MRTILQVVGLLIISLFFSLHLSALSKPLAQPSCTDNCYIIESSSLVFQHISPSYAGSILGQMKTILYEYLGRGKMEYFFFSDRIPIPANEIIKNYPTLKALKLDCYLAREEDTSILSVSIGDSATSQEYLTAKYISLFFEPNCLMGEFASSFPQKFSLPMNNTYKYIPKNLGYSVKWYGLGLDDVRYSFKDLVYDLRMAENVPQIVFNEIKCHRIRRGFYWTFFGIGGLPFTFCLTAALMGGTFRQPEAIIFGTSTAILLLDAVLFYFDNRRLEKVLNERLLPRNK